MFSGTGNFDYGTMLQFIMHCDFDSGEWDYSWTSLQQRSIQGSQYLPPWFKLRLFRHTFRLLCLIKATKLSLESSWWAYSQGINMKEAEFTFHYSLENCLAMRVQPKNSFFTKQLAWSNLWRRLQYMCEREHNTLSLADHFQRRPCKWGCAGWPLPRRNISWMQIWICLHNYLGCWHFGSWAGMQIMHVFNHVRLN